MDDEGNPKDNFLIGVVRQTLLVLILLLWMLLHLVVAMMVVIVSSLGRAVRWLGGWRTDLGMDYELVERTEKEKLWPPHSVCDDVEE
ncbi:uncharacterized protein LY89DRAFT_208487 [Mollisia scopiformis]|uniref:Transmembrane protein n=1 Tax=Mollisia scopiformis TaxID=149040 RepID=A0A194WXS8_MOLSC|nr:uncharacterized protein LY89DRAFT_208487 [Mollisia scopiformis]KUJ12484.1 hypothetical protein LY89DRAFT_208487 [Mollisia scopiformis]